jgi:hypothetical protein
MHSSHFSKRTGLNWKPYVDPSRTSRLRQAFKAWVEPGEAETPWGAVAPNLPPRTMGNHSAAATQLLRPITFGQLRTFLTKEKKRFAGNPRQLANAMAGCPDRSYWTSLNRCQKIPFGFGIHPRAMRAYIRHKQPRLYAMLANEPALPELSSFWRTFRTRDAVMRGLRAEDILRLWRDGEPKRRTVHSAGNLSLTPSVEDRE